MTGLTPGVALRAGIVLIAGMVLLYLALLAIVLPAFAYGKESVSTAFTTLILFAVFGYLAVRFSRPVKQFVFSGFL